MADALFDTISRMHGARPWGSVLDAGTGSHSLEWVCGLQTQRWVAITGDTYRERSLLKKFGDRMRPGDQVRTANWTDPTLLHDQVFDTVLADYLLGAIDGWAPYFQDQLFARLRRHTRQHLYVVGLAPYPERAATQGGQIVLEIARLRDACILMAGHRCYREYPMEWVLRALPRARFEVTDAVRVPIVYRAGFVRGQLDVCRRKLGFFSDKALAEEMRRHIDALQERALSLDETAQGIHFGEDYVVAARAIR